MEGVELLGYLAGVLTTLAVVPQIRKALITREVDAISLFTVAILICGLSLWTTYGVLVEAWPIIVWNGIGVLLNCFLLALVIHARRTQRSGQAP